MAHTLGRSGVPFLMARDVAKKAENKIKHGSYPSSRKNKNNNKKPTQQKEKTVTASKIRNIVANELRDRNRTDIAASYSGQTPENTLLKEQNLKDKQPVMDTFVNKNRILHDTGKRREGHWQR